MQEEIRIYRERMEELKLEIENFKSEQEMEVLQNNSKLHRREVKLSILPIENPQTLKPSFL